MTKLIANALTVTADQKALVREASLELTQGELIVVLGPNGAGKTSMIRGLLGLETPSAGSAHLDGVAVGQLTPTARAQKVAYLPQIGHLVDRSADTLSGGELARVHCARALATEAPLLIADEPTAALDPRHHFRILDLIKSFVDGGGGALLVLHDIELAARYATRLIWMKGGQIIADGPPEETLSAERLADVYQIKAEIVDGRVLMDGSL